VSEAVGGTGGSAARLRASTVDLGFEAGGDDLVRALGAVLADDGVDSVLVVCAPAPRQPTADLVAALARARSHEPRKTLLACVFGPHPTTISPEGAEDVPVFDFPDDAAYALGRVTRYARWREAPEGEVAVPGDLAPDEVRRRLSGALVEGRSGQMPTALALDALGAAGVPLVASRLADDADAAAVAAVELGYPVAVKAAARTRQAKTEAAGLALDVHDEAELRATLARMARALGGGTWPVLVQPMADPGVDVAVSVTGNPVVGPVLTVGPGGAATDLAAAEAHVLPLTDREVDRFVAGLPLAGLLGAQSRNHLDALVARVGALVDAVPEIAGLELNPVIVSPAGAVVVDARLWAAPVDRDPLPPVRRL
jgi:acyl-CoA synthetase (NDP forming)